MDNCIECGVIVRDRQEAVSCDSCDRWQHRTCNTVRRTWIDSSIWPVESWCVYGQSIRTNNDVEGWHRRLNLKGGVAPAFYNLVKLLYREGREAEDQVQLVGEMRLRRIQRKSVRTTQSRIFAAWESYRKDEVTTTGLLKLMSAIYRPRLEKKFAVADQ